MARSSCRERCSVLYLKQAGPKTGRRCTPGPVAPQHGRLQPLGCATCATAGHTMHGEMVAGEKQGGAQVPGVGAFCCRRCRPRRAFKGSAAHQQHISSAPALRLGSGRRLQTTASLLPPPPPRQGPHSPALACKEGFKGRTSRAQIATGHPLACRRNGTLCSPQ